MLTHPLNNKSTNDTINDSELEIAYFSWCLITLNLGQYSFASQFLPYKYKICIAMTSLEQLNISCKIKIAIMKLKMWKIRTYCYNYEYTPFCSVLLSSVIFFLFIPILSFHASYFFLLGILRMASNWWSGYILCASYYSLSAHSFSDVYNNLLFHS